MSSTLYRYICMYIYLCSPAITAQMSAETLLKYSYKCVRIYNILYVYDTSMNVCIYLCMRI